MILQLWLLMLFAWDEPLVLACTQTFMHTRARYHRTRTILVRVGGDASWQHERKMRALSLLIVVLDYSTGSADDRMAHVNKRLMACLLENDFVHRGLLDILQWVCGPLQNEIKQLRQRWGPAAVFDATETSSTHAMLLVVAAAVGLLTRLLHSAHGQHTALHDALLQSQEHSGVRCFAACMSLHEEMLDAAQEVRCHSLSPTKCHDFANLEREVWISDVEMLLPLSPVDVSDVGPLAARCLALMCHAVPPWQGSSQLLPHLSPIIALVSSTLETWLAGATLLGLKWVDLGTEKPAHGRELSNPALAAALQDRTEFTQEHLTRFGAAFSKDLRRDDYIKSGSRYFQPFGIHQTSGILARLAQDDSSDDCSAPEVTLLADCTSAALQLIGAAAESDHLLLSALFRGGLRVGESVRVHGGCVEPGRGWGLANHAMIGTVTGVQGDNVVVSFDSQKSWMTDCPSELELSAPQSSPSSSQPKVWTTWDELKPKLEKETSARKALPEHRHGHSGKQINGPLAQLVQLLESAQRATDGSCNYAMHLMEGVKLQAFAVISEFWRHPASHSAMLQTLRKDDNFWHSLGEVLQLPLSNENKSASTSHGRVWLCHAIALDILTQEIALVVPPSSLATPAALLLQKICGWLAGDSNASMASSGAGLLSATLLTAPVQSECNDLFQDIAKLNAQLGLYGIPSSDHPPSMDAPLLSLLPIPCARVHVSIAHLKVRSERSEDDCMPRAAFDLWAGTSTRLISSTPLLDVSLLELHAWRLKERELRNDDVPQCEASIPGPREALMTDAVAALDDVVIRALQGDRAALEDTNALLDKLPDHPMADNSATLASRPARWAAQADDLIRMSSRACVAIMATGAHAMLVDRWGKFVTILCQRGHLANPRSCASEDDLMQIPSWMDNSSKGAPFETHLELRVRRLADDQQLWLKDCSERQKLQYHAVSLGAAAELLSQQTLALHTGSAFAWKIVDKLMHHRYWKQRLEQAQNMLPHSAAPKTNRPDRTAARDIRQMALQVLLDDSPHLHRSDAGDGWMALHKLTSHICGRLKQIIEEESSAIFPFLVAGFPTIQATIDALKRCNNELREATKRTSNLIFDENLPTV